MMNENSITLRYFNLVKYLHLKREHIIHIVLFLIVPDIVQQLSKIYGIKKTLFLSLGLSKGLKFVNQPTQPWRFTNFPILAPLNMHQNQKSNVLHYICHFNSGKYNG